MRWIRATRTSRDGIASGVVARSLVGCVCVAAIVTGCQKESEVTSNAPPEQDTLSREVASVRKPVEWIDKVLAAPGAFDVVVVSDAVLVLWVVADGGGAEVTSQRFDFDGDVRGASRPVNLPATNGTIIELAAAAGAGNLGIAWVVRNGSTLSAWGTGGSEQAVSMRVPDTLGTVESSDAARGRVLVATGEDGEIQTTWRGERAACEAQKGTCSHYIRRSLTRSAVVATQRGSIAREMPTPCDPLLIGSLWADGSWYEAVCHLSPEQAAYVFSFRPAISYAEAIEALPTCNNFALSRAPVGAALWARCADGLAVTYRSHQPELNRQLRGVTKSAVCRDGRPVLRAEAETGVAEEFSLSRPMDGLGPALPRLPLETRAVWTGRSVIAGYVDNGALKLARATCRGDDFVWE